MRGLVLLVLLAACYDPSPLAGSPCSASGTCPDTLVCTAGRCLLPGVAVDSRGDDGPIGDDAPMIDAPIDSPMTIDAPSMGWATPTLIPGVNSTSNDSDPTFTADRLQLYFISSRAGGAGGDDIWFTKRASIGAAWDAPTNVIALESTAGEQSVEISSDGTRIWFVSFRNGANNGEIFTSTFNGFGWAVPTLVTELNTSATESDVSVSPDGLTAVVSRGSQGARSLHIANRAALSDPFGTLTPLTAINSVAVDPASPSITNNANTIYFHADSTRNIYISTKVGASWSAPLPVTEVNTAMRDAAPFITQGNNYMMFDRSQQLYETSR